MDAKTKQKLWVTIGVAIVGLAEGLRQNNVIPAQYAWAIDVALIVAGVLKGGALISKPGDSKPSA